MCRFAAYFGDDAGYSNTFIEAAIKGTGDFADDAVSTTARKEMANKSTQFSTMFMYVRAVASEAALSPPPHPFPPSLHSLFSRAQVRS